MVPLGAVLRTLAILGAMAGGAHANPDLLVPSAGVEGAPMSLHLRLDYAYELSSSIIMRERVGAPDWRRA